MDVQLFSGQPVEAYRFRKSARINSLMSLCDSKQAEKSWKSEFYSDLPLDRKEKSLLLYIYVYMQIV